MDQILDGFEHVTLCSVTSSVNSKVLVRQDDVESGILAQFTSQAADCRI